MLPPGLLKIAINQEACGLNNPVTNSLVSKTPRRQGVQQLSGRELARVNLPSRAQRSRKNSTASATADQSDGDERRQRRGLHRRWRRAPAQPGERASRCDTAVRVSSGQPELVVRHKEGESRHTFDYVFGQDARQLDVWRCVEPLVEASVNGFDATVFSHGQTGSGKIFTMGSGPSTSSSPDGPGIIPRGLERVFELVGAIAVGSSIAKESLDRRLHSSSPL